MASEQHPPARRRPSGRRTGDSGTRDAILDAARDLFAAKGYDGASIRAIAARAGVDPALVRHFFTDKERLFATTMADRTAIPQRLAAAFSGSPDGRGRRLTTAYFEIWEDPEIRPVLLGLVRSAMTSGHGVMMLIEALTARAREDAPVPHIADSPAARGFALAASHLFGTSVARHVLQVPMLADLPLDELVDLVAPAVERYLAESA
ncbi:TetR family transcriptional regulator [Microbacterium horticulturae]|uniref:TetR family transcriptional regulator n=1 Tax=Microbacterium horticulturae TaxID=3028316 RepID=A0ABY8BYT0_9MICO|nr:TetR family transcriptional regulator [Microbacterium sp. KACC 23027]WEG09080.1 TetR family transcriptional regulator [Microbacterium sp. KACC 23027]